jgi:hypothetical protein
VSTHRVLISVKPAFAFGNLLNRRLQGGAASCDDELLTGLDVLAHGCQLKPGLDMQGPPERFTPQGEIETLRCWVQPSATPWQPEPRIGNDSGEVLTRVIPLRDNSQQC